MRRIALLAGLVALVFTGLPQSGTAAVIGDGKSTAFLGGVAALVGGSPESGAQHRSAGDFGTFGSQQAPTDGVTVAIDPVVTALLDGSTETVFELPDGQVITTITPPAGFNPLEADDSTLVKFGFPPRPSDPADLEDWTTAMTAYRPDKSDDPPDEPLQVTYHSAPSYGTYYANWAGYIAGTLFTQSRTYVAVKTSFYVPSNTGTCSNSNMVGFWIGLGGTSADRSNSLVQQGVECGHPNVGAGSSYRPFTEFADTAPPVALCGYSSWTLGAGHWIYQNMSFQTSQNKAFFYLEGQTSGVAHGCSATPPSGWSWDLNTAEWIAEAPTGAAINFGSVRFTNARTQLYSNSQWVTLGSQPVTKTIQGSSSSYYCISPGAIGSGTAFTDYWHQSDCYN